MSEEKRTIDDLDPIALADFAAMAALESAELWLESAEELVDIFAAGELAADYEIRLAHMRKIGRGAGLNISVTCRLIDEVTIRHRGGLERDVDARRVQPLLRMVGESMIAVASAADLETLANLPLVDPTMIRTMLAHPGVRAWLLGRGQSEDKIARIEHLAAPSEV